MESSYKVVIVGLKSGLDKTQVLAALSRLFKKPPELLDQKLRHVPWVVKSGLSHTDAEKYISALQKAGTSCMIEKEDAEPAMARPAPTKQPKPPKAPERSPKKTCPKCGYQAFDDNDPLIKSFEGDGECPSCGVQVNRYLRKAEAEAASPESPAAAPFLAISEPEKSRKLVFIAAAAVVVILAVVLGWYFMGGKEAPSTKPAPKQPAKTAEPAVTTKEPLSDRCVIMPGNPQTITLSGFAPFFHASHQTGEIDPIMRISQNPWKDRGVEVKVASVKLTPVQVELWEVDLGGGVFTLPNFPKEELKVIENKGPGPQDSFIASVRYSENVLSYIEIGKLSESGVEELLADQKVADLRQATYTVYQMDINLSFSAPNGVADFTSDMGSRSGYIWVMLTGILTENGNETGGVDYQYGMKLQGVQKAGEKNLSVGLPEDNEYMMNNFSLDCR